MRPYSLRRPRWQWVDEGTHAELGATRQRVAVRVLGLAIIAACGVDASGEPEGVGFIPLLMGYTRDPEPVLHRGLPENGY